MEPSWNVSDVLKSAFELFKENVGLLVGATFAVFLASGLLSGIVQGIQLASNLVVPELDSDMVGPVMAVLGIAQLLLGFLSFMVQTYLGLGFIRLFLAIVRGQPATFGLLFSGGPFFLKGLLTNILASIIVGIGSCLCLVPGIIAGLGLSFSLLLVVDQQLGAVTAIQESWRLTQGAKLQLFLYGLAAFVLSLVGVLACGLGMLVTAPLVGLGLAQIYEATIAQKGAPGAATPV